MLLTRRFVIGGLRWYQAFSARRPPACRFQPSCSEYTVEAIESFGVVRGGRMATQRLLRCRPGGSFGVDPVPVPTPDLQDHVI